MLYFCSLHARMHAHTHTPRVCVELTVHKTFKQISFQSLLLLFNERERWTDSERKSERWTVTEEETDGERDKR